MSSPGGILGAVQWLGAYTMRTFTLLAECASLLYGALAVLVYVRTRGLRVVFEVTLTQLLFTGVHALPITSVGSLALSTLIISEVNAYPVDAATVSADILVRDVFPLLIAIIIVGRSGTAIAVEIANMKISGELDAIRDMGIPLEHFIVLPRLFAGTVAAGVLTVYAVAVGICGGYTLAKIVGSLPFALEAMLTAIDRQDALIAVSKSMLFGGAIVLVSIREAFRVQASRREIPIATTRSVVLGLAVVLVLNTAISLFV